jgi:small-conductance mechanosensitive channel
MPRKQYTQRAKAHILSRAAEIGISKAAKEYGIPYATIAKWSKESNVLVSDAVNASDTDARIASCEKEIAALKESLKEKKNELKALLKQKAREDREAEKKREAAAKAEAERKAAEEKKQLIRVLSESDKSTEEILDFLNS